MLKSDFPIFSISRSRSGEQIGKIFDHPKNGCLPAVGFLTQPQQHPVHYSSQELEEKTFE